MVISKYENASFKRGTSQHEFLHSLNLALYYQCTQRIIVEGMFKHAHNGRKIASKNGLFM